MEHCCVLISHPIPFSLASKDKNSVHNSTIGKPVKHLMLVLRFVDDVLGIATFDGWVAGGWVLDVLDRVEQCNECTDTHRP